MKIAQLVSNFHKVDVTSNHAIYSHVAWLVNKLTKKGEEVTLYASGDSKTKAKLISVTDSLTSKQDISHDVKKRYDHMLASKCFSEAKNYDIIHSHFSLLGSFYSALTDVPTVESIHSPITEDLKPFMIPFRRNNYISFSLAQRKAMPELNWVGNIYHGVNTKLFAYNDKPEDYFLFLGRITEEKGVHFAIEASEKAGVPLIIAGKSYPTEGYWHDKIEEHIDGKKVKYVGEANLEEKIQLLKNAKAVLFPTQYDEVFGLVMIEAMACGTPVIGWDKGSVPEIISHGKTGFVVKNVSEMANAIKNIDTISRDTTRKRAEMFFSIDKMVKGYINVYKKIISEHKYKKENGNWKH